MSPSEHGSLSPEMASTLRCGPFIIRFACCTPLARYGAFKPCYGAVDACNGRTWKRSVVGTGAARGFFICAVQLAKAAGCTSETKHASAAKTLSA